jgi:hypothetical protein
MRIARVLGTGVGSMIRHARRPAERFWFLAIVAALINQHGIGRIAIPGLFDIPFRFWFLGNWSYGPLAWPTMVLVVATVAGLFLLRLTYARPLLPYLGLWTIGMSVLLAGIATIVFTELPWPVPITLCAFGLILNFVTAHYYREARAQRLAEAQ